jgi:hypothetical protein
MRFMQNPVFINNYHVTRARVCKYTTRSATGDVHETAAAHTRLNNARAPFSCVSCVLSLATLRAVGFHSLFLFTPSSPSHPHLLFRSRSVPVALAQQRTPIRRLGLILRARGGGGKGTGAEQVGVTV